MNLGAYSTGQTEFGFFNFYTPLGQPAPEGFYVKGRVCNFMFVHDDWGTPKAASFEALFPGFFVFGIFFSEEPEGSGLPWFLVALANGELGYKKEWASLGVVNGFHPFFTRTPYHDFGLRLGIGTHNDFGISIFEQDRLSASSTQFGVRADYQVYYEPGP